MNVHQAFRFELGPCNEARSKLASHAGAARFVYGWGLRLVKGTLGARSTCEQLALRQGATMAEAQAYATEVVGPVPWSFYSLRKRWNADYVRRRVMGLSSAGGAFELVMAGAGWAAST